jgi:hypothetical protein
MLESSVRALAKAYFEGKIDAARYRRKRTRLLDDITAGQAEIEYRQIQTPSSISESEVNTTGNLEKKEPVIFTPIYAHDTPGHKPAGKMVLGGALFLVLVCVPVFFLLVHEPEVQKTVQTPDFVQTQPVDDGYELQPEMTGSILLTGFLDAIDWSPDGIDAFENRWNRLSEKERNKARQSSNFDVMANRLQEHIHAQLSREGLSDWDQTDINALEKFAERIGLGIDDAATRVAAVQKVTPDLKQDLPPASLEEESKDKIEKQTDIDDEPEKIEESGPKTAHVGVFVKSVPDGVMSGTKPTSEANELPESVPAGAMPGTKPSSNSNELLERREDVTVRPVEEQKTQVEKSLQNEIAVQKKTVDTSVKKDNLAAEEAEKQAKMQDLVRHIEETVRGSDFSETETDQLQALLTSLGKQYPDSEIIEIQKEQILSEMVAKVHQKSNKNQFHEAYAILERARQFGIGDLKYQSERDALTALEDSQTKVALVTEKSPEKSLQFKVTNDDVTTPKKNVPLIKKESTPEFIDPAPTQKSKVSSQPVAAEIRKTNNSSSKSDPLTLPELIKRDNAWALKQDPEKYCLQLGVFINFTNPEKFMGVIQENPVRFLTYRPGKKGLGDGVRVVYGLYPDKNAAITASEELPQKVYDISNTQGRPKAMKTIQQEILDAHEQ